MKRFSRWLMVGPVALAVMLGAMAGPVFAGLPEASPVVDDGTPYPTDEAKSVPVDASAVPECGAVNDFYTVNKDSSLIVRAPGVFANDLKLPFAMLWRLSTPHHGLVAYDRDGSFVYNANIGFVGTDTIVETIACLQDGGTLLLGEATITVTVVEPPAPTATVVPPTATATTMPTATSTPAAPCAIVAVDDAYTTMMDTALDVPAPGVFGNDTSSTNLTLFDVLPAAHGMATVGSFGEITYTPDAGFVGTDSFQYTIYCANEAGAQSYATATVSITVESPSPTATSTVMPTATATSTTVPNPTAPPTIIVKRTPTPIVTPTPMQQ